VILVKDGVLVDMPRECTDGLHHGCQDDVYNLATYQSRTVMRSWGHQLD
jgi:hypothetical protein